MEESNKTYRIGSLTGLLPTVLGATVHQYGPAARDDYKCDYCEGHCTGGRVVMKNNALKHESLCTQCGGTRKISWTPEHSAHILHNLFNTNQGLAVVASHAPVHSMHGEKWFSTIKDSGKSAIEELKNHSKEQTEPTEWKTKKIFQKGGVIEDSDSESGSGLSDEDSDDEVSETESEIGDGVKKEKPKKKKKSTKKKSPEERIASLEKQIERERKKLTAAVSKKDDDVTVNKREKKQIADDLRIIDDARKRLKKDAEEIRKALYKKEREEITKKQAELKKREEEIVKEKEAIKKQKEEAKAARTEPKTPKPAPAPSTPAPSTPIPSSKSSEIIDKLKKDYVEQEKKKGESDEKIKERWERSLPDIEKEVTENPDKIYEIDGGSLCGAGKSLVDISGGSLSDGNDTEGTTDLETTEDEAVSETESEPESTDSGLGPDTTPLPVPKETGEQTGGAVMAKPVAPVAPKVKKHKFGALGIMVKDKYMEFKQKIMDKDLPAERLAKMTIKEQKAARKEVMKEVEKQWFDGGAKAAARAAAEAELAKKTEEEKKKVEQEAAKAAKKTKKK